MLTKIILSFLALAGLGLVYYLIHLGFAEIIKWLAKRKILCVYLKENRIIQIDDGEKFNEFVLSKKGYSFQFQKDEKEWKHEREKWEIVKNQDFNLDDHLFGFKRWCMKELGIYWFGGWLFSRKVRVREVELFSYDQRSKELEEIERSSPYLFATDTLYAWEIRNAEDITGNSFHVDFGVIASVKNPYIVWIENEKWDQTFGSIACSAPLSLIKSKPFHILSKQIQKGVEKIKEEASKGAKNDAEKDKENDDEIAEAFSKVVIEKLRKQLKGFDFKRVTLFNVDPENPGVFEAILKFYTAQYDAEALIEVGRGEAGKKDQLLVVERNDLKERLAAMDLHPESARLSTIKETFKNVTVLGGDQMTLLIDPKQKAKND